ncbi:type IX secretion system motor protein PorM/GldM [Flavicella sediminum]|uniref:type IX secretion system motor protein PorM/GldM n=1 Tax=Flavicella sediminum TaxID=2585141 RepID=UPI00111D7D4C|nr:gliding motility protein GldM [Flavicella sediminum]
MAGGKQSARQKMINLMYLVFIAMLALNMGKKVLSSFGYLNQKIETANEKSISDVESTLEGLSVKASEQPEKYGIINDKAIQIHDLSMALFGHVQGVKDTLLNTLAPELHHDYESMDTETAGDEYFFTGEKFTKNGELFISKINEFKEGVKTILGEESKEYAEIKTDVEKRFDISDQEVEGAKQPWLRNRYEGFPLVATLTNLSVIQSDVKATEKDILAVLMGKQLTADASISQKTYRAIVLPSKPAYFAGEQFEGSIVLGKYDASLQPDRLTVNGKNYTGRDDKGAALVKFKTGSVGENKIIGEFVFQQDGKPVVIPINSTYLVVNKPNSAVVSADKMNVVYRGVQNPITISIPGIADSDVKASATGLKKASGIGKYTLSPGKGKEVVINVSGKTPDGTVIKSPPVTFRIKDIPPPAASIRKQIGSIRMPKSSLAKSVIDAALIDFDFDLKLKVSGFKIKVPGQSTVVVNGTRLDARAQKALTRARRGDVISIFDVKASIIGNSSYRLKGVLPLSVELTN